MQILQSTVALCQQVSNVLGKSQKQKLRQDLLSSAYTTAMCRLETSFSSSGNRIFTNRATELFSLARSFTLSNLYLVSDFSSSLWYAVFE